MGKDNRPPKHLRTLRRGDVREDGMVFVRYSKTYRNGEHWAPLEKLKEIANAPCKDNRPPVHLRTLRRGDVRKDGMIFWEYCASLKNGERWLTRCGFEKKRKRRRETHYHYVSNRLRVDVNYRLANNLRSRIRRALKGGCSLPSGDLLGCSIDEIKTHLEAQFSDGMTWDNHGLYGWHIDHIKPCASFDLTLDKEKKKCFHYSNLQPLWAKDNLQKGEKEPAFL